MTVEEHNVKTLMLLGLTNIQAKIFLALSTIGESTIKQIALSSKVARPDTYRAIKSLQEQGLIQKTLGMPAKFKAEHITSVINTLLCKRTNESIDIIRRIETLFVYLQKEKNEGNKSTNKQDYQFNLIFTGHSIFLKAMSMIDQSNFKVTGVITTKNVFFGFENLPKSFEAALNRNVAIEMLTVEPINSIQRKQFLDWEKFENFELRYIEDLAVGGGFLIIDDKEILVVNSPKASNQLSALVTDSPTIIEIAKKYFENLLRESYS